MHKGPHRSKARPFTHQILNLLASVVPSVAVCSHSLMHRISGLSTRALSIAVGRNYKREMVGRSFAGGGFRANSVAKMPQFQEDTHEGQKWPGRTGCKFRDSNHKSKSKWNACYRKALRHSKDSRTPGLRSTISAQMAKGDATSVNTETIAPTRTSLYLRIFSI